MSLPRLGHPPTIRPARPSDRETVEALLVGAGLPTAGLPSELAHFLVADLQGRVVGAIGLEVYGTHGLLRSAVVDPALRGSGVGEALVDALIRDARALGLQELVLLTTTAEAWFPRFGFHRIAREDVAAAVHASAELRGACPASAVVMRRPL